MSVPPGTLSSLCIETSVLNRRLSFLVTQQEEWRLLLLFGFMEFCGWHLATIRVRRRLDILLDFFVIGLRLVDPQDEVSVDEVLALTTLRIERKISIRPFFLVSL